MVAAHASSRSGFLVGAVVGVPLGALLAWGLTQRTRAQDEVTWARSPVLSAARALPAGHVVAPGDLVEDTFPAAFVTTNCATPESRHHFEGQTLRWPVVAGIVVRATDLVVPNPACATRVKAAGARLGLAANDPLVSALVSKHGGVP